MVRARDIDRPALARIELLQAALTKHPDTADLMFRLADAFAAAGDEERFVAWFRRAFLLKPSVQPRLAEDGGPLREQARNLRSRARMLIEHGVAYAPVIAALAVAEGLLGNVPAVKEIVDYRRFLRTQVPCARGSAGMLDDLERELRLDLHYCPRQRGKAGSGWYRFNIFDGSLPACAALATELGGCVERYIADLPPWADHPFVASCPGRFRLRGWSVLSRGDDSFASHLHPQSWLSGVYYISQPKDTRGTDGWLSVAMPAQFGLPPECGWEEVLVEPCPGQLCLMPGYFYHETRPTHSDQERLCVAFDVVPEELDAACGDGT